MKNTVKNVGILTENETNLKKLKFKIRFFIRIMQMMRGKGQRNWCGNNESQEIVQNSYKIYQIVRELVQYEKQTKNIDIQYVNLTKKYKNILTHLQKNSRGKIKMILS